MKLYKAVKPDGTDFYTGRIDYAAQLGTGKPVRHSHPLRDDTSAYNYLSVSTEPGDCTGFRWPARLFEVTAVGKPWTPHESDLPNKRAVTGVRVIVELPAHLLFGPQGEAIVAIIDHFRSMSYAQRSDLYLSRPTGWTIAYGAVAFDGRAARAGLGAARSALGDRLGDGWIAGAAAYGAALAVLLRHTIGKPNGLTQTEYDVLTAPWLKVTGKKAHPEDVVF